MTYRDMTFCSAKECKHFSKCHRALTADIEEHAKRLELPIAQFIDHKQLYCYKPHESKTDSSN